MTEMNGKKRKSNANAASIRLYFQNIIEKYMVIYV